MNINIVLWYLFVLSQYAEFLVKPWLQLLSSESGLVRDPRMSKTKPQQILHLILTMFHHKFEKFQLVAASTRWPI